MRYLILFLFLISNAFAMKAWHKVNADGTIDCKTVYTSKKYCGDNCYARKIKQPCETLSLQDKQVDDPSRPIYDITNVQDCESKKACRKLIETTVEENPEYDPNISQFLKDENGNVILDAEGKPKPNPDYKPRYIVHRYCPNDYTAYYRWKDENDHSLGLEAYCAMVTGYHKKTIKVLAEDPAKKAAYEAQKQQKEGIEAQRKQKLQAIKNAIDTMPDAKIIELMRRFLKRHLGKKDNIDDFNIGG